jgi:hypothetical protein
MDSEDCPVCYESSNKTFIRLSCNHVFCIDCLNNCVNHHLLTCPLCRSKSLNLSVVNKQKISVISLTTTFNNINTIPYKYFDENTKVRR